MDSFKLTIGILAMFLGVFSIGAGVGIYDGVLVFFGIIMLIGSVVALAKSLEKPKLEV